jgi:hypothetical protein
VPIDNVYLEVVLDPGPVGTTLHLTNKPRFLPAFRLHVCSQVTIVLVGAVATVANKHWSACGARAARRTCSEMFVSIVDVFYQVPFQFGPESATFEVASELRVFAALTAQVSLQVPQILVGPSTVRTTIGFVAAL